MIMLVSLGKAIGEGIVEWRARQSEFCAGERALAAIFALRGARGPSAPSQHGGALLNPSVVLAAGV